MYLHTQYTCNLVKYLPKNIIYLEQHLKIHIFKYSV